MSTGFGYIPGDIVPEGLKQELKDAFGAARDGQDSHPAQQTLLSKIAGHVDIPRVNASAMERSATQAAPDLPQTQRNVNTALEASKGARADMKESFDTARTEAIALFKQVAADNPHMGITERAIDITFASPDNFSSEAVNAAGSGSVATHLLQTASAVNDLRSGMDKLSSTQINALANEAAVQANSNGGPLQKASFSGFRDVTKGPVKDDQSVLEGLDADNLKDLANGNFDQQPEVIELDAQIAELEDVQAELKMVENNQFDGAGNKLEKAIERGDVAGVKAMGGDTVDWRLSEEYGLPKDVPVTARENLKLAFLSEADIENIAHQAQDLENAAQELAAKANGLGGANMSSSNPFSTTA